jgi:predicted MFS family arabinose efflux permease
LTEPAPAGAPSSGITPSLTLLFAVACGAIVANIYLSQPIVALIAPDLGLGREVASLIVTLAQLGYGAGLLLLVPLGDIVENRRLIVATLATTVLALAAAGAAGSASLFLAASFLIGTTSTAAQMLVPLAAHLAPDSRRGRVVGNVMSGLILGILLARPVSSLIADLFGWRAVFVLPAALMTGLAVLLWRGLPQRQPALGRRYGAVLGSMLRLMTSERLLQRRTAYQAALFAGFSLFWTAVPLRLAGPPFDLTQRGIALFALAGAAGALSAPVAGRLADSGHSRLATGAAILMVAAAFPIAWIGRDSIAGLILAALVLDFGVQMNQVVGQRAIYGIHPEMRSRINGIYMAIFFAGGALGSALVSPVLEQAGWGGLCALGLAFPLSVLGLFAVAERASGRPA